MNQPIRGLLLVGVAGLGLTSCGDGVATPAEERLTIEVVGPRTFPAEVATEVLLSVRVQQEGGMPRSGVTVSWSVLSGGGSIASSVRSSSDEEGRTDALWRLGSRAGPQRAAASIVSHGTTVVAEFIAEAQAGPPASIALGADSVLISAVGETVLLLPAFTDAYGNAAQPTQAPWTSSDPAVATVAVDGLVTGRQAGVVYVSGSVGASSDSLLVTVALRGTITMTFDDGWRSAHDQALPVFQEFGLSANVAVNPVTVGWPGYLELSQLRALHEAGWSMVSHGMNHARLPDLTDAQLDDELRGAKEFLDAQGFRGSDIFIVPYHHWGDRERTAVTRHHRAARGVTASQFFPTDSLVGWMPSEPLDMTGMEADSLPYTTPQGRDRLRSLLQRTRDEGAFVDLFFHRVPPENVSALRQALSIVDEFRDRVLPYHELFPERPREIR
jgi:peptidoglycan/xylan/chitin deacetylase (PgdA/CDA1 family)